VVMPGWFTVGVSGIPPPMVKQLQCRWLSSLPQVTLGIWTQDLWIWVLMLTSTLDLMSG